MTARAAGTEPSSTAGSAAVPEHATKAEQALAVVGLAALIVSLLIYSASVTAFGAHPGYTSFMTDYAPALLSSAALVSGACALFAFFARQLPQRILLVAGSLCFLAGSIGFAFLALTATTSLLVVLPLALVGGTGDVALCLIWGRIYRRFPLRHALFNVSAAGILSAGAYWALSLQNELTVTLLFSLCAVLTVALGWRLTRAPEARHAETEHALGARSHGPLHALPSLADVIALPMLGLMFFAYTVAVLRKAVIASFGSYLVATVIVSAILLAYLLFNRHPLNLRSLHLTFIPLFAVVLLTVSSLSAYLALDQAVTIFIAFLLYVTAAILTLASLAAIAHAAEFAPDLIFSLAVFLFSLASVAGLLSGKLIADESVNVALIIATTVYAFVAMLFSYFRWRQISEWSETGNAPTEAHRSIPEICARIAQQHQLTAREEEVLRYLAEGHNGAFISEVLLISPNTARTHIHNIYRKLDVSSREDILRLTRS